MEIRRDFYLDKLIKRKTTEYLEAFLRNLLLNEKNELRNRNLHISGLLNEEKVDIGSPTQPYNGAHAVHRIH